MRELFHFYKNKPEWMNEFSSQLRIAWLENKSIMILAMFFIAVLFFVIITSHKNTNVTELISLQNKHSETILRELNDINSILHNVESNPSNTKQQQMVLQSLEKDIISTQKSMMDVAKSSDIQKVSNQISLVQSDIDSQINDIKKTVSKNIGSKEYLDASSLPFHVISVDVIAGQPYVSVEYASHISPLSVGDLLTGWKVVSVNYDLGISEFVNEKNQYIKVSLQGA